MPELCDFTILLAVKSLVTEQTVGLEEIGKYRDKLQDLATPHVIHLYLVA